MYYALRLLELPLRGFGAASTSIYNFGSGRLADRLFQRVAGTAALVLGIPLLLMTVAITEPIRSLLVRTIKRLYGVHAVSTRNGVEIEDKRGGSRREVPWAALKSIVYVSAPPDDVARFTTDNEVVEVDVIDEVRLKLAAMEHDVWFIYDIDGVQVPVSRDVDQPPNQAGRAD